MAESKGESRITTYEAGPAKSLCIEGPPDDAFTHRDTRFFVTQTRGKAGEHSFCVGVVVPIARPEVLPGGLGAVRPVTVLALTLSRETLLDLARKLQELAG